LYGDPQRLGQILRNLVSNALKFTLAGSISVRLAVSSEPQVLEFRVRDTGIGIAPATLATLFRPFTQADSSITRRFGGTGLGLTICKTLTDLMDGTIDVTSRQGEGSEFVVRLPLVQAPAPGPSEVVPERGVHRWHGQAVLVAEDNKLNQLVLGKLLKVRGLVPVFADNGRQAVDAVVSGTAFALVLMDLHMPEMDGLEASRRIHAVAGREHLPIVACTSAALDEDRERTRNAGMVDHLSKPIQVDQLDQILESWIKR
jgi:CheY-like chemotaxis protein